MITCFQKLTHSADKPGLIGGWFFVLILMKAHWEGVYKGSNGHQAVPKKFTVFRIYDLVAWDGWWSLVSKWRYIYKSLIVCPFDSTAVAGSRKVGLILG